MKRLSGEGSLTTARAIPKVEESRKMPYLSLFLQVGLTPSLYPHRGMFELKQSNPVVKYIEMVFSNYLGIINNRCLMFPIGPLYYLLLSTTRNILLTNISKSTT